jgi:UDP-N-acetylglucosamine 2-epimerase (non-hydrolysing)
MKNNKYLVIIGTRPEAIKLAPLIIELRKANLDTIVVSTGQQPDLVKIALCNFDITADVLLDTKIGSLTSSLSSILLNLEDIVTKTRPTHIIAQGDTTSVTASALVAAYNKLKFVHVEAGLRSNNRLSPFPEEFNRELATLCADYNFCPTKEDKNNIAKVAKGKIHVVGNTIVDAIEYIKPKLKKIVIPNKKLIFVTAHRRENFGKPIEELKEALKILENRSDLHFVLPVHTNPNISNAFAAFSTTNLIKTSPLDYISSLSYISSSSLVLTDSGGIQEEAPSFQVPCLVMRDTTERTAGLATGHSKLITMSKNSIVNNVLNFIDNPPEINPTNPYGTIGVSKKIINLISNND